MCQQVSGQPHFTGQADDGLATLGPLSAGDLRDETASSYISYITDLHLPTNIFTEAPPIKPRPDITALVDWA